MPEVKKARIAFVGCGGHATHSLFPAVPFIPEIELVAVCDLREELAQRNARWLGALRWYTDVATMLAKEELDGVVVVGPPQMHYEVGKQCLDAGLPIFVEKPSALSAALAQELAEHAERKGLWGAVAYMKRFAVGYELAKQIAQKRDEFGQVTVVEIRFSNGPYPAIWGIPSAPQAFLIGQAVHLFNLARYFGGEVEEVYARLHVVSENRFGYAINLRFAGGALGILNLNALESPSWKIHERMALTGVDCWLEVEDMLRLRYRPRGEPIAEPHIGGRNQWIEWQPDWTEILRVHAVGCFGYAGELQNFARSCLGLETPRSTLWDGARDLQVAEAVWRSAQTGEVVRTGSGT